MVSVNKRYLNEIKDKFFTIKLKVKY